MLELIIVFSMFTAQDSLSKDSVKSIMFLKTQSLPNINKMKYRHQQGFFCDFEDQINKGRKLNLNIGVGEQ